MKLEKKDFDDLVSVLKQLPDLQTEQGRVDFVSGFARGLKEPSKITSQIVYGGAAAAFAGRLVERLELYGADEPGKEVLGILINTVLDLYLGAESESANILYGLFERYPLDVPVAKGAAIERRHWYGNDSEESVEEKIIGEDTLRDIRYLELALSVAKAVVRIRVSKGKGTGFMFAPDLLMTNYHVVHDQSIAAKGEYTFNYQLSLFDEENLSQTVGAVPDGIFYASEELDYSVIQLKDVPDIFEPLHIKARQVKRDSRVTIIQHPGGHYKKISMQNNFVAYADNTILQYTTSTDYGSSGSPVFNDEFEVVGIHHKGGNLTEPNTMRRYLRNEAVSMNAILKDLKTNAPMILARMKA